ncbi:hypothetical protein [Cylindrospermopsis raciborskii]|uniref:hypothetical protein n=1 Tax=Cylindrospermopsis raciborskii TaxID=77022 RepID=UPI003A90B775
MLNSEIKSPLTNESKVEYVRSLSPQEIANKWQSSMDIDVGSVFRNLPAVEHWRCV